MKKDFTLDDFFKIESRDDLSGIKARGVSVWPLLRIYIASQVEYKQDTRIKPIKSLKFNNVKSIFFGWTGLFKPWNYLAFSSSDQRKLTDGIWTDKMDELFKLLNRVQLFELPAPKHFSRATMPDHSVAGRISFYLTSLILGKFVSLRLEGGDKLDQIKKECGISLNERLVLRNFFGQLFLGRFLIRIKSLKAFFLTTPYTNLGYVYAFKEQNIPVIEFQHGTINEAHYAYKIKDQIDSNFYPDFLLSYGSKEKDVFNESNYISADHVIPVGSFYLDYIKNSKKDLSSFNEMKQGFKRMVAVSAQDRLEEFYVPFLKTIAERDHSTCFWLLPRHRSEAFYKKFEFPENVVFNSHYNTYEAIYLSDFHTTVNSTTALESIVLGTPNVLMDVESRASNFFGKVLNNKDVTMYAQTPQAFLDLINSYTDVKESTFETEADKLFKSHYSENLKIALKQILVGFND